MKNNNLPCSSEQFGGKFSGLEQLSKIHCLQGKIPNYHGVRTPEELEKIIQSLDNTKLYAVRSSGLNEDGSTCSLAGHFSTHLEVATDKIGERYNNIQDHAREKGEKNAIPVVVQEMVSEPEFSGVAFSRSVENPNYLTISLINGLGENLVNGSKPTREIKIHRLAPISPSLVEKYHFLPELVTLIFDIENHFGTPMDIEFAVKNGELKFLQARPITSFFGQEFNKKNEIETFATLMEVQSHVRKILSGQDSMLGNMIDINPRELQGEIPNPLSVSLFSRLFPEGVIQRGRDSLGYSCSQDNCLHTLGGRTYINFRVAAQNFRPSGIGDEDYDRICQHYLSIMKQRPQANSSVEFGLFFIIDDEYTKAGIQKIFGEDNVKILSKYAQLRTFLDSHSHDMVTGEFSDRLNSLNMQREELLLELKTRPHTLSEFQQRIRSIIDLLREYTEFFVIVARLDFYQTYQFRSLTEKLDIKNPEDLLLGNETFYIERLQDQLKILDNCKDPVLMEVYLEKYGHMRYHQFDLHVPTDRELFGEHFSVLQPTLLRRQLLGFQKSQEIARIRLNELEKTDTGILRKCVEYTRFLDAAREQTKFEFMKLYDALNSELGYFARLSGISQEDLKFVQIHELEKGEDVNIIKQKILTRKKIREAVSQIVMPDHIFCVDDVLAFEIPPSAPIFVGSGEITNVPVLEVGVEEIGQLSESQVGGKLILLEDSDQGASRILELNPAGVITKIGSAHSHLSICIRETTIPGILNIGEIEYKKFRAASQAHIDFKEKSYHLTQ